MEDFGSQFQRGIELFNDGEFYECHDTLEDVWLQESSDRQPLLQGLIQAAVAFHHYRHGKLGAARSMLRLALEKLDGCPDLAEGLRLADLRRELRGWENALNRAVAEQDSSPLETLSYPTIGRLRGGG